MRRPGAQATTNSFGHASPPTISLSKPASRARSSDDSTVGVRNAALTRWLCSKAVSGSPAYTCGGATTSAAPDAAASTISPTDASKVGEATINTRVSVSNPHDSHCAAVHPSRPAWLTITPLGVPVEPEVKIT
ncbi:hypothetical protein MTY59_44990 [Mycobacterium senriense]|uniref:Uncharacterized protein n=1 Tax=Mycobacterium senriense TaxID=2775496 RepID=A0ABM7STD2_9MYCO|nr:hypothetical protein MTY59_44990 [Mycobacterium senriense]